MRCPQCGSESRVIESRPTEDSIRRRRECTNPACGYRYTTYEHLEERPLLVVKQDGRRQAFDRDKLIRGVVRACHKLPVSIEQIESLVTDVERELRSSLEREIPSSKIGSMVLERLLDLNETAWIRYAIVYCKCQDIKEIRTLIDQRLHAAQENKN